MSARALSVHITAKSRNIAWLTLCAKECMGMLRGCARRHQRIDTPIAKDTSTFHAPECRDLGDVSEANQQSCEEGGGHVDPKGVNE